MRGTILGFDSASGEGVINDGGGGRVKFGYDGWKGPGEPAPGRHVDFDVAEGRAVDIYAVPGGIAGDPDNAALVSGIISLVCAILTFVLGPFGIFTLIAAIVFGIKGKNQGAGLPDKTGYYLSVAGLVISAVALILVVLTLAACVGLIGLIGLGTAGFGWS